MAHLFKMMYDAFDLEGISVEDVIRIVFSCVLEKRIGELEDEEKRGKSCQACVGDLVHGGNENRWMKFAGQAITDVNPDIMWSVVETTCRVLSLPSPTVDHRLYFDNLFNMSWVLWERIFIGVENSARIERLSDYIMCVCKLKF